MGMLWMFEHLPGNANLHDKTGGKRLNGLSTLLLVRRDINVKYDVILNITVETS